MAAANIDHIIREFVLGGGQIVCLSHDPLIHKTLLNAFHHTLAIKEQSLHIYSSPGKTRKTVDQMCETDAPVMLLAERELDGKPNTFFLREMHEAHPEILLVGLMAEPSKEAIAYLHELGAKNIIVKPVSVGNILEKLAFTIQPQDEIGRLLDAGKALLGQDRTEDAQVVTRKIMTLKPNSPAGYLLQGDIHARRGETDRAVESYASAHAHAEFYLEPMGKMARLLKKLDPTKALEYLKKMDWISPLNAVRKAEIGSGHLDRDEQDMAREYFDKSLEVAGKEAPELKAMVAKNIAESAEQAAPELAEYYYQVAIDTKEGRLGMDDITTINKLGIQLRNSGRWREAIRYYDQALKVLPGDANLLYNKGLAYLKGGMKGDALACFEGAMKTDPEFYKHDVNVALNIGNLYYRNGRLDQALVMVGHAHTTDPDNKMAADLLAQIEARTAK